MIRLSQILSKMRKIETEWQKHRHQKGRSTSREKEFTKAATWTIRVPVNQLVSGRLGSSTWMGQYFTRTQEGGASQLVLVVKNPPAIAGDERDLSVIPGLERSPGGQHGNPLQYSIQYWIQTIQYGLSLAWRIPWTEENSRLQITGSHRVGHKWSDLSGTHSRIRKKLNIWLTSGKKNPTLEHSLGRPQLFIHMWLLFHALQHRAKKRDYFIIYLVMHMASREAQLS